MPGRSAAPSRLSRQVGPSALEGFENEGFVRFDDSSQAPGLVACRGAQKPMTPTKRRRRMDSAERRGLRQALALDHRARVIEPAVLLAQMRHRRPGQRIEGAPAALAAKPQKPMRAAPADDFAARAMGTPLSRHALDAGRSERVLLAAALAALLGGSCSRAPNHARLLKRNHRLPALVLAHPRNRRQPSRKIFNLHRIALPIRTTLTKSTTNAIRALRMTSTPYPLRIVQPYSPLNQLLQLRLPASPETLKLTGSKSGGPTLGSVGGAETRVRCRVVFGAGASKCFDR